MNDFREQQRFFRGSAIIHLPLRDCLPLTNVRVNQVQHRDDSCKRNRVQSYRPRFLAFNKYFLVFRPLVQRHVQVVILDWKRLVSTNLRRETGHQSVHHALDLKTHLIRFIHDIYARRRKRTRRKRTRRRRFWRRTVFLFKVVVVVVVVINIFVHFRR